MEKDTTRNKSGVVIVVLSVLLAVAVGVIVLSQIRIYHQEGLLGSAQSDSDAVIASLTTEKELLTQRYDELEARLGGDVARLEDELEDAEKNVSELETALAEREEYVTLLEREKVGMNELLDYMVQNHRALDFNDDLRVPTAYMPTAAITLIETFFDTIGSGNQEAFLGTLLAGPEGLPLREQALLFFEQQKGKVYRIGGIYPTETNIAILQTGGYVVSVAVFDADTQAANIALQVIRDAASGQWVIGSMEQ